MDSITQAVLGATVGYAVLGRKIGRKAALYGAALGTLPDLDVLVDFGGPVENMTYHRGATHSFFVQLLVAPLFAWFFDRWHRAGWLRWAIGVYLIFATHTLADAFTVYGTQVFWPFTDFPFAHAILFIVDPVYTIPLIVATLVVLASKNPEFRGRFNTGALVFSTAYLLWAAGAKWHIDSMVEQAMAERGISPEVYESTPAPLTTLLWRGVAIEGDQYYEIFASVLDAPSDVTIKVYPRNLQLLNDLPSDSRLKRLKWFTKGQYGVWQRADQVFIADLRMGFEGSYVFNFEAAKRKGDQSVIGSFAQLESEPEFADLGLLFKRIVDPAVVW